ncbi:hypothetical protein I204_04186 [Kwoniella mangroviensis CBS 8886]|nr:hypothetical protein I204_04186 [Kwoniella mangroviensis CBS 8886]
MRLTAPPRSTSLSSLFILPIPLGLLIIAYLAAVGRRPDIPESAQVDDPHQWGFPKWYGNHPTPFDYRSTSQGEEEEVCDHPKNVLLFIDLSYDSPQIPSALTLHSSLTSSNRYNLTTISSFSPTWNWDLSPKENLQNAGCDQFDWIWKVGDESGHAELGCREGKVIWVEEGMKIPGTANVSLLTQPHHILKPEHKHDALKTTHGEGWELGLLTHVLPSVNSFSSPKIFYPSRHINNRRSIVYFPLRTTATKDYPKLPWGRTWSIYSPSRRSPPLPKAGEDPFSPNSRWRKFWLKDEERLAKAMRDAGICLFEGWQYGELDDRIAKAMLSGCIVATVPPQTHHDAFSSLILPLATPSSVSILPDLPVDNLNQLLHKYTNSQLQRLALKAFISARNRLVPPSRLKGVESAVQIWEDGGRGYDFKKGFRWDCDSGHGGWCG